MRRTGAGGCGRIFQAGKGRRSSRQSWLRDRAARGTRTCPTSSATRFPGSGARMRASPTSTASIPGAERRDIGRRVNTSFPQPQVTSTGTSEDQESTVSRFVSKLKRFLLFIPITRAPAYSAG